MPRRSCVFAFCALLLSASVSGHVYIKHWKSSLDGRLQMAQKADSLSHTAYRPAPNNIGFVGSNFLTTNRAIVCGASETPKGTVKPAGGKFFSDASESAGMTLPVNAGGKITLVISGDATKAVGYPHLEGHIQTYLGLCGTSPSACQSFDAATASYFKIQEERDGVHKLRQQMSGSAGGDIWEVPIPQDVPQGSYIFRFEIITFGESVASEGYQDQYYPSCGQIYVQSTHQATPSSFSSLPLLRLPGGYHNGKMLHAAAIPGPSLMSHETSNGGSRQLSRFAEGAKGRHTHSRRSHHTRQRRHRRKSRFCLPTPIPRCAKSCLKKKLEEVHSLAPTCSTSDAPCLCGTPNFVGAYRNCLGDHCSNQLELAESLNAFGINCQAKSRPLEKLP